MIDDLDRIMAIMQVAFDPHWGEAWNRRQVESSLVMPTTHYSLLDAEGETPAEGVDAAAFAMVRAAPGEEEVLLIAVHPKFRSRGLAGRLIDRMSNDARARGAERIFLEMRENNPAELVYRRYGFEPIGRRPKYYTDGNGDKIDAITFAKSL
ncbi:GNAT family N-acetyltransferase [Qipengyuania sp. CAU 1752]